MSRKKVKKFTFGNLDTGEIFLESGKRAADSEFHPVRIAKEKADEERRDRIYADAETVLNEEIEKFLAELEIEELKADGELGEAAYDLAANFAFLVSDFEEIVLFADYEPEDVIAIVAERIASL